jgi:hypothetical protein
MEGEGREKGSLALDTRGGNCNGHLPCRVRLIGEVEVVSLWYVSSWDETGFIRLGPASAGEASYDFLE